MVVDVLEREANKLITGWRYCGEGELTVSTPYFVVVT